MKKFIIGLLAVLFVLITALIAAINLNIVDVQGITIYLFDSVAMTDDDMSQQAGLLSGADDLPESSLNSDTEAYKNFEKNSVSSDDESESTEKSEDKLTADYGDEKITTTQKGSSKSTTSADKTGKNTTTVNKSTTTTKPKYVETVTEEKLTDTSTKYGVIIKTYTVTEYDVYSDGSKVKNSESSYKTFDKKNFKATTAELTAEAKQTKSKYSGWINSVVSYVNSYRDEANTNSVEGVADRGQLTLDSNLCTAACVRAVEMAYSGKFSHTRPDGSSCFSVGNDFGIYIYGENIAMGYTSAKSVSEGWKNSSGHYSNMIMPYYSKIGVGVANIDGTYYWVQLFA